MTRMIIMIAGVVITVILKEGRVLDLREKPFYNLLKMAT